MSTSLFDAVAGARAGARSWAAACLFLGAAAFAFSQVEIGEPVSFHSAGVDHQVTVRTVPGGSAVFLRTAEGEKELSLGGGEDLFPAVQTLTDRFVVLWIHCEPGRMGLGLYDSAAAASRVLSLPSFSFLSTPTLVFQGGEPRGIVFLGNESGNDDIYFFDLWGSGVVNLSRTRVSEKKFTVAAEDDGFLVSTVTLQDRARYFLDRSTLSVSLRDRRPLERKEEAGVAAGETSQAEPGIFENTYVAEGDSITWGKMRMNNLQGDYHPELAFPAQMKTVLAASYGPAYPVNLGIPGDSAYGVAQRVEADLKANPGLYFLLMIGTNDCIVNTFSIDSVMEDIEFVLSKAEAKAMRLIISTIPPRKDSLGGLKYVQNNIAALNAAIAEAALRKKIGFVDTYTAFMSYAPPDGWKSLMEDVVGNHPSPAGHLIIATMFADALAAFPPGIPSGVKPIPMLRSNQKAFQWDPCLESDFSYFRVEYGYGDNKMVSASTTKIPVAFLTVLPYQLSIRMLRIPKLYFRIQAVDRGGRAGPYLKFQAP